MTTRKQVLGLLTPLLERSADLVLNEERVLIKPIRHTLRGILVPRTGPAGLPEMYWFIGYTLDRESRGGFLAEPMFPLPRAARRWGNPALAPALRDLVERTILPMLRPIDTLDAMLALDEPACSPCRAIIRSPFDNVRLNAALGRFEAARPMIERLRAGRDSFQKERRPACDAILDELAPLMETGDRVGVAQLLHRWEAANIRRWKLGEVWEPTPFPLERESV